jgi:RNA polymerase sigma-70 factor (ECF subfamily)
MNEADPLTHWAERLRAGVPEAAQRLFSEYALRLAHVAEQHLSSKSAGRLDRDDVVQSVFRTFFRRSARGEFRFDGSEQLWSLLVCFPPRSLRSLCFYYSLAGAWG